MRKSSSLGIELSEATSGGDFAARFEGAAEEGAGVGMGADCGARRLISSRAWAAWMGPRGGGWLVVKSQQLERNITIALALAGLSAVFIALGVMVAPIAVALMGVLGFGLGLSGPSRDMLIRSATPVGATGRVYGVVYSGLDVGIALAPVAFGGMMDHGYFGEVFYGIAACMLFSILTAWRVARTEIV